MLDALEHPTSFVCIFYLVEKLRFWCKRGQWGADANTSTKALLTIFSLYAASC